MWNHEDSCFDNPEFVEKIRELNGIGEKIHSDFNIWAQYNEYVLPIIQKIPEKFALLCNTCHKLISILQSIKDDSRFERLVDLARRSRG